jgi:glycosyltransferase involved in cell wall biosynthesis
VERALIPAPARPATGGLATGGSDRSPATLRAAHRAALGVRPGENLLVTVARLAPQKGLPLLLDALELLVSSGVPVRAVIAGDGPLEAQIASDAADRHLPLTLLGRRDDVPDLLVAADVVVVPSVWEGQPLIVSEALRAPAAIVATDVGGTGEVAGDGALLVPGGQPEALAAAVASLLADPDAREALRARAAGRARQLPTDADAGHQVLAVYRAALNGWPPRGGSGPGDQPPGATDNLEARGAADS